MEFILKINGSESENAEFVGWTPIKCTLTIDEYNGDIPMPVTITPEHKNKSGRIDLYLDNSPSAFPVAKIEHDFQTEKELTFYVAGKFGHPSIAEKDTYILVKHETNVIPEIKKGIMVRVRKNANKLSDDEITMFLEAFVNLNDKETKKEYHNPDDYSNYPKKLLGELVLMHTYDAIWEIHQRTSFHPWHRIFNLHLERELQAINPHVTIPYWKFDEKAERVFTPIFIGETEKTDNPNLLEVKQPKFSMMNPLRNYINFTAWGPLNRAYLDRNPATQDTFGRINGKRDVLTEKNIVEEGPSTFEHWSTFEEFESHNLAHNVFTGDVADAGKDPIDPLFFMMHSNVDRLWAKWQHRHNRYDSSQKETYPFQGKYPGKRGKEWIEEWKQNADSNDLQIFNIAGIYRQKNSDIGNFTDDTLWPWDLDTEDSRPMRIYNKDIDEEFGAGKVPEIKIEFPKSPNSHYPVGPITVKSTVDYQDRLNNKTPLGFDYDDIPYFQHNGKPAIPIAMNESKDNNLFQKDAEKSKLALTQLQNKKNDLSIRLNAIGSIDETSEVFLDTVLEIIEDSNEPEELRVVLINEMVAAKRSSRFFPSRKPRFFNILRGLITNEKKQLRFQAIDILTSGEDPIVQEFLIEELKKDKSEFISKQDAIFFLRKNPKPQHANLFRELLSQSNDPNVKKAAILALGNDPGSEELLKSIVLDNKEDYKTREASALSLHNLNHEKMNDLAAQILTRSENIGDFKLFRNDSPDADEVDFKAGLLNMLTFTGDINRLKQNENLKNSLKQVVDPLRDNKSQFKTTFEVLNQKTSDDPTDIQKLAEKLLKRLESSE